MAKKIKIVPLANGKFEARCEKWDCKWTSVQFTKRDAGIIGHEHYKENHPRLQGPDLEAVVIDEAAEPLPVLDADSMAIGANPAAPIVTLSPEDEKKLTAMLKRARRG